MYVFAPNNCECDLTSKSCQIKLFCKSLVTEGFTCAHRTADGKTPREILGTLERVIHVKPSVMIRQEKSATLLTPRLLELTISIMQTVVSH